MVVVLVIGAIDDVTKFLQYSSELQWALSLSYYLEYIVEISNSLVFPLF